MADTQQPIQQAETASTFEAAFFAAQMESQKLKKEIEKEIDGQRGNAEFYPSCMSVETSSALGYAIDAIREDAWRRLLRGQWVDYEDVEIVNNSFAFRISGRGNDYNRIGLPNSAWETRRKFIWSGKSQSRLKPLFRRMLLDAARRDAVAAIMKNLEKPHG
jgi:hypothetical protein